MIHFHFMEEDPLPEVVQAKRLGVRDEVDFVAPVGQVDSQFSRHCTGAPVRGITCDPDFHSYLPVIQDT